MKSTGDEPMTIEEAAAFCRVSKDTFYRHTKQIPHFKRFKRSYFFKSDLIEFLRGKEVGS